MAWLASWIFLPSLFVLPPLLFLLFPTGRILGPRWRPVGWLIALGTLAILPAWTLEPGLLGEEPFEEVVNPVGVEGAGGALDAVGSLGWFALAAGIVASAASMVVRLRRARGVERQQLKWVASAAALFAAVCLVTAATLQAEYGAVGQIAVLLAYSAIPLAAGIAILRHRLYDIDLVINRALVYGALTVLLAGAYVGLVLLLGLALSPADQRLGPGDRPLHPGRGGALRAGAQARPGVGRPALLPAPLRRRPHPRALRRPPALPDRPGGPARRADRRRGRDHAAGPRVAVAAGGADGERPAALAWAIWARRRWRWCRRRSCSASWPDADAADRARGLPAADHRDDRPRGGLRVGGRGGRRRACRATRSAGSSSRSASRSPSSGWPTATPTTRSTAAPTSRCRTGPPGSRPGCSSCRSSSGRASRCSCSRPDARRRRGGGRRCTSSCLAPFVGAVVRPSSPASCRVFPGVENPAGRDGRGGDVRRGLNAVGEAVFAPAAVPGRGRLDRGPLPARAAAASGSRSSGSPTRRRSWWSASSPRSWSARSCPRGRRTPSSCSASPGSRRSPSPPASRCCATGSTRSTSSSTARWSTAR